MNLRDPNCCWTTSTLPVEFPPLLFRRLDKLQNALIDSLEVRGGVARRVIFQATDFRGASAAEPTTQECMAEKPK